MTENEIFRGDTRWEVAPEGRSRCWGLGMPIFDTFRHRVLRARGKGAPTGGPVFVGSGHGVTRPTHPVAVNAAGESRPGRWKLYNTIQIHITCPAGKSKGKVRIDEVILMSFNKCMLRGGGGRGRDANRASPRQAATSGRQHSRPNSGTKQEGKWHAGQSRFAARAVWWRPETNAVKTGIAGWRKLHWRRSRCGHRRFGRCNGRSRNARSRADFS